MPRLELSLKHGKGKREIHSDITPYSACPANKLAAFEAACQVRLRYSFLTDSEDEAREREQVLASPSTNSLAVLAFVSREAAQHCKQFTQKCKKKKRKSPGEFWFPPKRRQPLIGTSSDRVIGPRRVRARQNRERPRCRDQPRRGQDGAFFAGFFLLADVRLLLPRFENASTALFRTLAALACELRQWIASAFGPFYRLQRTELADSLASHHCSLLLLSLFDLHVSLLYFLSV